MRSGVRIACFYMHARQVVTVNLDVEEHQNRVATLCTRVYLHTVLSVLAASDIVH